MLIKNIKFGNMNKQDRLQSYINQVLRGETFTELVRVRKTIYLFDWQWDMRKNNLLDNVEDYDKIGGRSYIGSNREIIELLSTINDDFTNFFKVQDEIQAKFGKRYFDYIATDCVMVCNTDTDEKMFINTEGYDYARYVGLEEDIFKKYAYKEIK